jgi:hypothetical protein
MSSDLFRKYIDIVNEAADPTMVAAKKIARGISKIQNLGGGDDGLEWLSDWDSPIGDAWLAWNDAMPDDGLDVWLYKTVDPKILAQYADDVNGWVNDAKFDIGY